MLWQPGMTLDEIEKIVIMKALRFFHNNKSMTARSLGIAVRTLDNKLKTYQTSDVSLEKKEIKQ